MKAARISTALFLLPVAAFAQQVPDLDYNPPVPRPAYERHKGPVVTIDEFHQNTQTYGGQLQAFVQLLKRDGYRVQPLAQAISAESLRGVDVLVIGNPGGWDGPAASLREAEVAAVCDWVRDGGSLLLILDHMPSPAGGAQIAAALGVKNWHNGYAMVETSAGLPAGLIIFRRVDPSLKERPAITRTAYGWLTYQGADASLKEHPITAGRGPEERVDSVMTFVGSAFQPPDGAQALMVMPAQAISLTPKPGMSARDPETPRTSVAGWLQGAVMKVGKGRVALFGEAAMFSAQLSGPEKRTFGMNEPCAAENHKFVLNVMHWLTGLL